MWPASRSVNFLDMPGNMLAVSAAQQLTQQIRVAVDNLWDLVVTAYQGRAWKALGYSTWDAYVQGEFGSLKIRIPKEDRREICSHLRDHGLSLRAISAATGYDKHTVSRDLTANFTGGANAPVLGQVTRSGDCLSPAEHRPSKPAQPPNPREQFWKAATDICKMANRVSKLADQGGFCSSRERVLEASLRDLHRARRTLDDVIAKLEGASV